jgi:hypothetical protein
MTLEARRPRLAVSAFAAALLAPPAMAGEIGPDCTLKGLELWGDVEIVESFPDLKVQVVESFPDLNVEIVESFADKCGKWRFVTSFPKLKIQYVDSFPDLKIRFVTSFPGIP